MGNQQSKHANSSPSSPRPPSHSNGSRSTHVNRDWHHGRHSSVQPANVDPARSRSIDPSPTHAFSPPSSPPFHRPAAQQRPRRATEATAPPGVRMGNSQSHEAETERQDAGRRRDRHHHHHQQHHATLQAPPPPAPQQHQQQQQSHPVQVPEGRSTRGRAPTGIESSSPPSASGPGDYAPLSSNLNFPPRLPLPIQEEDYTPGSPIITAVDVLSPHGRGARTGVGTGGADGGIETGASELTVLDDDGGEGTLPHQSSLLSNNTTVDGEEEERETDADADAAEESKGRTVPTVIKWRQPGSRVYITGTFAAWSKKYRMHRDPKTNVLSTKLELLPGTHHVKFIVDGDMQLSRDLPTAVDYTNILVNYIEISADDIPKELSQDKQTYGLHPPLALPPGTESNDFAAHTGETPDEQQAALAASQQQQQAAEEPTTISTRDVHYGTAVPNYLLDLDRDEKTNRFQRAANHVAEIPPPPSLPLFLSKSILNGTMPMKDDASVLNMPNHTVLNHLATSSIKNDVLATSLTTRYKRKYVTTIIYRPTNSLD